MAFDRSLIITMEVETFDESRKIVKSQKNMAKCSLRESMGSSTQRRIIQVSCHRLIRLEVRNWTLRTRDKGDDLTFIEFNPFRRWFVSLVFPT